MDETFGATIRRHRQRQGLGLRQYARHLGVSASYLSSIERDTCAAPAEHHIRTIARDLSLDPDTLLAQGGRVATDLQDIIRHRPRPLAALLRSAQTLTTEELTALTTAIRDVTKRRTLHGARRYGL
tara:strand:+ start:74 stop:451 length:378 start_codon:yes stop_codon:yes gene_type:complete